jgi:polar amino acid transport system substrate-binding protein
MAGKSLTWHGTRRVAALATALAAAPNWAAAAAPVPVAIYADDNYPPYSFVENGKLTGIYTRIIEKALERMPEYQLTLTPVPWQRGIVLLEKGAALALYPPYYRPLERPFLRYSEPMLTEQTAVFCNAVSYRRHSLKNWPDDYAGLRIGINAGFLSGGARFDAAVREGRLSVHPAHGSRSNLLKLLRGRIDCYINDRLSIQWELRRIRDSALVDSSYQPLTETTVVSTEQGFLGYTELLPQQYPYRRDFIDKFNHAIRAMRGSGEIDSIANAFLNQ